MQGRKKWTSGTSKLADLIVFDENGLVNRCSEDRKWLASPPWQVQLFGRRRRGTSLAKYAIASFLNEQVV